MRSAFVAALVVNCPKTVPEWESSCRACPDDQYFLDAAKGPHFVDEFVTGKNSVQRHQVHNVSSNFEAVAYPSKQAGIWRVADDPINLRSPRKEVASFRYFAPLAPIWQQIMESAAAPAGVQANASRGKVLNHGQSQPWRRVDHILFNRRMEKGSLRNQ
jgi:hypothetical protein